ncbi:MAG: DUF3574 domain-containing protein [Bacteroidetes bacterium]|nr:DUF3574 domain-containing protein [Bacteroidota bacterium]
MRRLIILACLILSSCAANHMVETDLYFGLSKPGGGMVTGQEWNNFKNDQVWRVLKDGNTIIDATGSWLDPKTGKPVTEPSRVVICLHKNNAKISRQIDSLRQKYKTLFNQESVLRVDKKVAVSF